MKKNYLKTSMLFFVMLNIFSASISHADCLQIKDGIYALDDDVIDSVVK